MVSLALVRNNLIQTERHMDRMRQTGEDIDRPNAYAQLVYNRERLGKIERELRQSVNLSGLGLSKIILNPLGSGSSGSGSSGGKTYTWVNPSTGEIISGLTKEQYNAYKLQYKYQQQAAKAAANAAAKAAAQAAKAAKQQAAQEAKAAKQQAAIDAKAADRAFKLELEKQKYAAKYGNVMTDQDLDNYFSNMYQSMPYGASDMYAADPSLLPVGYDVYGSINPSYQDAAPMSVIYEAAPSVYYDAADDYSGDYDDGAMLPQAQLPQIEEYENDRDDNSAFYETDADGAFDTLMGGIDDIVGLPRAPAVSQPVMVPQNFAKKTGNAAGIVLMCAAGAFALAVMAGSNTGKRRR